MKGRDLDKYQTRGESRDESHHGGCYRDSERQHPISSARPLQLGNKKRSKCNGQRGLWRPTVCGIAESGKANLAPFVWDSSLLTLAKLRL
jgi:hypothetical protein